MKKKEYRSKKSEDCVENSLTLKRLEYYYVKVRLDKLAFFYRFMSKFAESGELSEWKGVKAVTAEYIRHQLEEDKFEISHI